MTNRHHLREVAALFLRLGLTAFGGPAAHIAMMREEIVKRRKWVDDRHFLDLLGATNLIPGPNSTEMAIHLGFVRAGWAGLIVGGVCFIVPAMLMVMAIAWAYVRFGTTPEATWLLYGVKPVVIAIIVQALWGLGQKAVKGPLTAVIGLAVLILYFLGVNEIALLFAGGFVAAVVKNLRDLKKANLSGIIAPLGGLSLPIAVAAPFSVSHMFLIFLKIGAVLYGSGYVLLAFLRADFVTRLGWLTDRQLIDAIAVGQVTPGPVFTTATFIGYILGDVPGALLATIGIFLPSFVFVVISNPLIPRLRHSPGMGALLDGINIASLGLMAAVTIQLGRASFMDPLTIAIAVVTAVLLFYFRVSSTWLVMGGAVVGLLKNML
ncbi:MAG: chromate transporter [Nitrospirae bacterium]|nr:chromate transporter [Nitrospirota bacterium]